MMLKRWLKKYKKDPKKDILHNLSLEFASVFGDDIKWQWDDNYDAVLLHMEDSQKNKTINILESYFSDYWNVLVDEELPPIVKTLVKQFDGMSPEQLLFSTDTSASDFLYCAWWPWKDGKHTSLRIARYMKDLDDEARLATITQIKQWFDIAA